MKRPPADEDTESEVELDCRVWRLPRKLRTGKALPPLQAWEAPPGLPSSRQLTALAAAARKLAQGGRSFWISARAKPQSAVQRFALDVFHFHLARLQLSGDQKAGIAGAEVWAQRRSARESKERRGMNWHFDKDEDLLDECGLCVHPLVGTATYLTDAGAPLTVLTQPTLRVDRGSGPDPDQPQLRRSSSALVAYPRKGLHVAFSGQLLHGVPGQLEEERGKERLALLVNVWLLHRPLGLRSSGGGRSSPRKKLRAGRLLRGSESAGVGCTKASAGKRLAADASCRNHVLQGAGACQGSGTNRDGDMRKGKLEFGARVTHVKTSEGSVEVRGSGSTTRCSRLVCALPPANLKAVTFEPPLPSSRQALHEANFIGCIIKSVIRYGQPFWRNKGFSGEVVAESTAEEPVFNCYDHCIGDSHFLVCFMNGAPAKLWSSRSQAERKEVVLKQLTKWFGQEANEPLEFLEKDWVADEFTTGCPVGCYPPNTLAPHMQALREPCGLIHWAGTESADSCQGFMDGAVQAAQRCAREVIAALEAARA
ncbi:unnamed protein product [Effrenium voratum]|uniref:Amine oxidase n=1 Tax=Effrenium voratum TaxID=2562239 RepID=A0AA36N9V8_9DINO|nr:unnamed protein product [Effrenium voratum]